MDQTQLSKWREYAFRYFIMNADQRMKSFNFFIVAFTVLAGGIIAAWAGGKADNHRKALSVPCAAVTVVSIIFYVVDLRSQRLIKYGTDALVALDRLEPDMPEALKFFDLDAKWKRSKQEVASGVSYTLAFRSLFALTSVGGIAGAIYFWITG